MTLIIGIIGKPSAGKSTFLNAACMTHAKVSELPFTTIDPNKGVAYVKTNCMCKKLNLKDNPKNSICIEGNRFIPINLLDVAGLVPDAHKGKGLGNKFLNDLSKADILIHILDISGELDKTGKRITLGKNDPYEDIIFLEKEINLWFKEIIERTDWTKFLKSYSREKTKFIEALYKRLSGVRVKKKHIILAIKNSGLENKDPINWTDDDLYDFSKIVREHSKPILVVANKIDKENGIRNLVRIKAKYNNPIIPCSALAEFVLRKYQEDKVIKYIPGLDNFHILNHEKLKSKELETLEKIRGKILGELSETGVQNALNHAIFQIANQICVFPVSDINTFTDHDDNVLPDVFLVEKGTNLKDFVQDYIHTDLAEHFMFGIDALTKKRLGENYELKHNDVIKIVSSR
ncbi:MAG: YchF-related putative GTPase [Promethearchaeota archaeon]|jgi:ribosome-binding ATPase YchF (GTP1/OBG family)